MPSGTWEVTMLDSLIKNFKRMLEDESGLSAVEYGLLAAGIAVGLYTFIAGIGSSLRTIYGSVSTDLAQAP
jgi:pilus assembly protein Flp/PilA